MHAVALPAIATFDAWRDAARAMACADVPAEGVTFRRAQEAPGLFARGQGAPRPVRLVSVPRAFPDLARAVSCHSDGAAHDLLYAALLRLQTDPRLLEDYADPLIQRLRAMERAVRSDVHKMHAFLRFREMPPESGAEPEAGIETCDMIGTLAGIVAGGTRRRFAAWFEPSHHIVEHTTSFFERRFADMDWLIATPDLTARFTDGTVSLSEAAPRPDLPEDGAEGLWQTYFANIFNPARLNTRAMRSEMPRKYWKNMPEAALIPGLVAGAAGRARAMRDAAPSVPPPAAARVTMRLAAARPPPPPEGRPETLEAARAQAAACARCTLHCHATQTVFGEGPRDAPLMIVGEQPGDHEDLAGRPFVGPAGQLFDRVAGEVGLDRHRAWITNAVKHFKFTPRGKRRLHQRPDAGEVQACRWWLDLERDLVKPRLILAMGATAALSLTGRGEAMGRRRGTVEDAGGTPVLLTWHPSYLLRLPDAGARAEAEAQFRDDLAEAVRLLDEAAT